jgi:hypothetical protein
MNLQAKTIEKQDRENLPSPITKEAFEARSKEWLRIISSGESGSILFFPKTDRLRRIPHLLNDQTLLMKYLKDPKKYIYLILDLDLFPLEEVEDLEDFTALQLSNLNLVNNYPKFSQWAEFFKKEDLRLIMIVANAEKLLGVSYQPILNLLASMVERWTEVQALLFFERDILHPQYREFISSRTTFLEHFLYYPLYSEKDINQFIFYLSRKWKMKIPEKLFPTIVKNCGGHFWLIKEAIRYLRQSGDIKKIFNHEAMNFRLENIYNSLLESEKSLLKKIAFGETSFDELERHSLSYLQKLNLINRNNKITIGLLENYIRNLGEKRPNIIMKNGSLLLNNVPIQTFFSRKEYKVLKGFLQNQDKVIGRDEVAQWIWPTNTQENYSDWAIDQLIARLRKRLTRLFIPKEALRTLRGRGYMLSFEK